MIVGVHSVVGRLIALIRMNRVLAISVTMDTAPAHQEAYSEALHSERDANAHQNLARAQLNGAFPEVESAGSPLPRPCGLSQLLSFDRAGFGLQIVSID